MDGLTIVPSTQNVLKNVKLDFSGPGEIPYMFFQPRKLYGFSDLAGCNFHPYCRFWWGHWIYSSDSILGCFLLMKWTIGKLMVQSLCYEPITRSGTHAGMTFHKSSEPCFFWTIVSKRIFLLVIPHHALNCIQSFLCAGTLYTNFAPTN